MTHNQFLQLQARRYPHILHMERVAQSKGLSCVEKAQPGYVIPKEEIINGITLCCARLIRQVDFSFPLPTANGVPRSSR